MQVWKGLEDNIDQDNIDADPDLLSEAVARAEEWLTAHARSKVFAVFNAEVGFPGPCEGPHFLLTISCKRISTSVLSELIPIP